MTENPLSIGIIAPLIPRLRSEARNTNRSAIRSGLAAPSPVEVLMWTLRTGLWHRKLDRFLLKYEYVWLTLS